MGCKGVPPNSTLKLTAARQLGPRGALVPEAGPPQLSFDVPRNISVPAGAMDDLVQDIALTRTQAAAAVIVENRF